MMADYSADSHEENPKLKSPEEFYSSADNNQKLSYFYNSNRIITSVHAVKNFLKDFQEYSVEQQQKFLNQLLQALRTVTTNAYLLNEPTKKKPRIHSSGLLQHTQDQRDVLNLLIELVIVNVKNYLVFNLLQQVLQELLSYSSLENSLLRDAIQKLTVNYYENQVHASQLFATVTILKSFFHAKLLTEKDPNNMLVFHGSNKVQILPRNQKPLMWILKEGFTLFFWINIENVKSGVEALLPKLFTFYAPEVGGVESYMIDNKIYYRIIGAKYTEPQIGSNGSLLGQLQPRKWNFICFEHEGHHTFQKSKLKFYLNKAKPNVVGLDPPKISSSNQTKYIFLDKIYCKTSSICLFPFLLGQQDIEQYNKNISSLQNVKNPKALVFQNRQGKIYERTGFGLSHNFIFERNTEMNFQMYLPLFYLLRYQQQDQQYPILNELLSIFVLFLRQSANSQNEAYKNGYFKIISELICDIPRNTFDENTIKSILYIKHTITDTNLLDQYFSDFLWPLLYAHIPLSRKQEILQIIKNAFTQNIAHYSVQIGLDEMINLLQKLEGSSLTCCQKHFKIASNKFERSIEGDYNFGEQKKAQSYIFSLIENSFQNSKINYPQQIYKLCRLLCLKFSPCFIMELMGLIRKLLTQKFNERMSENHTKQIIKYLQQKKVHLIFIHVIQNNFFAEIKAESVKLIYTLLLKKSSSLEETQISHLISKSLWKINEFAEKDVEIRSEKKVVVDIQEIKYEKQSRHVFTDFDESNDKQFTLVGPQAPALSNRLKGQKTFDFGFVNQIKRPRQQQIMEEQKTTQPQGVTHSAIKDLISKKDKIRSLCINTEAINEMYTFGGQNGQQVIISQDQQKSELQKIMKLAKKCVAAMKGEPYQEQIKSPKKIPYVIPPMTTKNKALGSKKLINLNLISEEEDQIHQKVPPTPSATKKSNRTPTSIKSSNDQNVFTLYNSLLECCLGVSFQTSLIANSKIQVPSILSIFFKWIPQTDLQTKFLNDLDIILESNENMALVAELPQLYDFLFELSYKCLLFEQMKEKRVYTEKLQNLIKGIFIYVFKQDVSGFSKFAFILDWVQSKKDEDYEPKCLFLASRYVVLLILECIEENLIMNNTNDHLMERNFQSFSIILDTLKKVVPEGLDEINVDHFERVVFTVDFELPQSLIPYFKCDWADYILYQKYLFLFKRFYCTKWYLRGLQNFSSKNSDLISFLMQTNIAELQKESTYYLKHNFLISLIEIQRAMFFQLQHTQPKQAENLGDQSVWQTILLVLLIEVNKDKVIKNQRSQIILTFLKSCKLLAEKGVERIVDIVPMLSAVKHFLSISSSQSQSSQKSTLSTQILDDIISNYIPEYLLNMGKTDLDSFILHFSQVWIPNENHYKKIHSDLFINYQERIKKEDDFNFIEFISTRIEQQNERRQYTDIILESHRRVIKNGFRKLWYSLRVYGSSWTHPYLKMQHNSLFNKNLYSYQKYAANAYFKYKLGKHNSKGKGRFFLKPRLVEPHIFEEKKQKQRNAQNEYNLQKALKMMNSMLLIGSSKKGWIVSKKEDALNFVMGFKKVKIINTLTVRTGFLAIISDNLVFVSIFETQKISHYAIDQYRLRSDKTIHKSWPLEYIRQIYKRRYVNRKKSVQINFIHNKSLLLDFQTQEESDQFCKKLVKLKNKCINLVVAEKSLDPKKIIEHQDSLKKWMNYEMTTFDYLMELNTIASRSFSDLTQYPVFPWTLKKFDDNKCNINEEENIRNLALPMGANGSEDRTHNFQERYDMMQMQAEYATKFHYGTHYSSPGIIYHFLIRLSPFTQGSILLQSGKFDFADRLFFSIADSYKNATSEYSDVRELIPEMYTIPEAYLNINGLEFGLMQNKRRVHNVELPEWCRQNPYLFVYNMRKCLEEQVSSHSINNWIDLIFGYKQRGEEAFKSLNCYYYVTYEDAVPWPTLKNQKQIQSIQSQIVNFGQTPSQLFTRAHPQRTSLSSLKNFRLICDPQSELKVYRPSRKNTPGNEYIQLNPLRQADESIIFMKWISDTKLYFIRRSGDVILYKCYPNSTPASRVPFQCTVEKQKKVQKIRKPVFDPNEFYDPSLDINNFPMDLIGLGHMICLGGLSDGKLALIDVDTGSLVHTYTTHRHTISCLRADPRQNFLISGDIKGNVIMWQIKTNSNNSSKLVDKKIIRDQKEQISSIFYSQQLQCVAISSFDGSVFVYNTITGKKLRVYYHPKRAPINEVIITSNPLAAVIFFCNSESTIYSYSLNGQLIARVLDKASQYFLSPILMKDSKSFEYLAYGNQKSEVMMKTLPFLEQPANINTNLKVARDACVNKISISKYGRFLVSGCSDGELTMIADPNLVTNS